jgi:prepilin-type N-terminal cleavage/methylation domain-containing protein
MRKGLTLIEVILALIILTLIIGSIYRSYTFFISNVSFYVRRANVHMQIDYAMENIRLHCLSANSISPGSFFPPAVTSNRNNFNFEGEFNLSNITPNNFTDNANYLYSVSTVGVFSGLLLRTRRGAQTRYETLVDSSLNPNINFTYTAGTEPKFMTVTIEAGPPDSRINRTEGVRFWFVDIVQ